MRELIVIEIEQVIAFSFMVRVALPASLSTGAKVVAQPLWEAFPNFFMTLEALLISYPSYQIMAPGAVIDTFPFLVEIA